MKWHEKGILILVLYSVVMFFVELSLGGQNSLSGPRFFLWSERAVASILTLEMALRFWYHSPHTAKGTDRAYFDGRSHRRLGDSSPESRPFFRGHSIGWSV